MKWETLKVRRGTRVLGRLQVCEGRPTQVGGSRLRDSDCGERNVWMCKARSQGQRGPKLRGVKHLVSEGCGGAPGQSRNCPWARCEDERYSTLGHRGGREGDSSLIPKEAEAAAWVKEV